MSDSPKNKPPETADHGRNDYQRVQTINVVPQRNRWVVIAVIVLLVGGVVALGVYAMSVRGDLDEASAENQKANESLDASQKSLESVKADCESQQASCKETQQANEEQIAALESALASSKTKVGELRDAKRQAARELAQFKAFSARFQRMINSGKLEVVFRRGRMVVNLPAQVLFDSGSADLSEEGRKALQEVAKILRTVPNKRFVVGGHTDDQKIKRANFKSNWELSAARAITVTEALIKAGMKPSNLIAAGYSQFSPIASNNTEEGRQKNRRIEIILEPYLQDIEPPKKAKPKSAKGAKKPASKAKSKKK
jgi:chemotaxis protein MotB